jgi:hypothetical protein
MRRCMELGRDRARYARFAAISNFTTGDLIQRAQEILAASSRMRATKRQPKRSPGRGDRGGGRKRLGVSGGGVDPFRSQTSFPIRRRRRLHWIKTSSSRRCHLQRPLRRRTTSSATGQRSASDDLCFKPGRFCAHAQA